MLIFYYVKLNCLTLVLAYACFDLCCNIFLSLLEQSCLDLIWIIWRYILDTLYNITLLSLSKVIVDHNKYC